MPIDHVLLAVADVRASAAVLWRRHGLAAIEGGVHPGWGTANWLVPLGSSYLELVYVDDPVVAAESAFGRRARDVIAGGGGPYAWAVAPADVEAVAARLRLPLVGGSRRRPDGRVVTWRTVGLGIALEDPSR
ncbi:MAG TPA: VOC family protein, partial [Candidatus Limnocylindrales bacterium]|nr:VOC family protein [Candidatus Limnocylindrales bacterium]